MKGKKVVVTGGAGFIGSNLADELAKDNDVIVIDNLATGRDVNLERSRYTVVDGDIRDLDMLMDTFKDVHYVFHQAALPSVPRSVEDPITTNAVNVEGTLNVLVAARDNDVEKVVAASSSSVYGDTPTLPKQESMCPNPKSPYALTKLAGEMYCRVFYEIYGLRTTALRYFNVYGPRQDPNSQYAAVIPIFFNAAREGRPFPVFGDGKQTRDFTFVSDVVQANIKAAESDGVDGKAVNVAYGERVSLIELGNAIADICGIDPEFDFKPSRKGDVKHSLADLTMAKQQMDYYPQIPISKGLEAYYHSVQG
jgi:UDP-glucose 4-epimerase